MVARSPPPPGSTASAARERRRRTMAMAAALNPVLIRETVKKVDRCLARLQELQSTVAGGRKVVGGVTLSPRSTKSYLTTSLRCKHQSLLLTSTAHHRSSSSSPTGKFPFPPDNKTTGEWRGMSLPAMLLAETVTEILQFATKAAAATTATAITNSVDPKTPVSRRTKPNQQRQNDSPELRLRRRKEKQQHLRTVRTEFASSPSLPRARARISFKPTSPVNRRETPSSAYRHKAAAHRVSPNRPWSGRRTAVLFPNPTFMSPPPKKSSPPRRPARFVVKSPTATGAGFPIKKTAQVAVSPTTRVRRSFSPSRLATRLVSPLKSRIASACRRRSPGGGGGTPLFTNFLMSTAARRPSPATPNRMLRKY